jgi:hypothetical protein
VREPCRNCPAIQLFTGLISRILDKSRIGDVTMKRALLIGILASCVGTAAFAQAGSVGGTIGNTDKSVSGGTETEQARRRPKPPRPTSATSCQKIVGTWAWNGGTETVFRQDGSGQHNLGSTSRWTCGGGRAVARWNNGYVDRISISSDGNSLLVTNNQGTGFTATRK